MYCRRSSQEKDQRQIEWSCWASVPNRICKLHQRHRRCCKLCQPTGANSSKVLNLQAIRNSRILRISFERRPYVIMQEWFAFALYSSACSAHRLNKLVIIGKQGSKNMSPNIYRSRWSGKPHRLCSPTIQHSNVLNNRDVAAPPRSRPIIRTP